MTGKGSRYDVVRFWLVHVELVCNSRTPKPAVRAFPTDNNFSYNVPIWCLGRPSPHILSVFANLPLAASAPLHTPCILDSFAEPAASTISVLNVIAAMRLQGNGFPPSFGEVRQRPGTPLGSRRDNSAAEECHVDVHMTKSQAEIPCCRR